MLIPLFKPQYDVPTILAELGKCLDSGWTGLGPKTVEFERAIAKYTRSDYSVFLNSATSALHLAVECLALPPGSRIAVPDITFVSTAAVVLHAGHVPVLLPVDESMQLDLDSLESCISTVDAVIVVHYSGNSCDMRRLLSICASHGVPLIEDCAHALGSSYGGQALGTFGEMGCFSYHSVKNLPIADGGSVVGRAQYEKRLRSLRWLGIDKPTYERTGKTYSYEYDVTELGYKYHGNDLMAVLGLAGLGLLDQHNSRRREIHDRYVAELGADYFPAVRDGVVSSHHLVACLIDRRDAFLDYMAERGISVGVHYRPISSFSFHEKFATSAVKERGQEVFKKLATLPCYPSLSHDEQTYIIEAIRQFEGGRRVHGG